LADETVVEFRVGLAGRFQAENAALAFLALRAGRPETTMEAMKTGFAQARLPGRMEVVGSFPPVVLDGAHTPLAARRLLETWRELFTEPGVLLFGSVEGKNAREMAQILGPAFDQVIVSTPGTFKPSSPQEVTELFLEVNPTTRLIREPAQALSVALELAGRTRPVLVTGSFYMLGEVRGLVLARQSS
jgi:dihydrofolate synthase/folylpolyglutamate synthase